VRVDPQEIELLNGFADEQKLYFSLDFPFLFVLKPKNEGQPRWDRKNGLPSEKPIRTMETIDLPIERASQQNMRSPTRNIFDLLRRKRKSFEKVD
jgi:hypothetical protein